MLEVGFGAGRSSRVLWEQLSSEGSYCGLDVVADMVEWHERNVTPFRPNNVKFFHANVATSTYDDGNAPASSRISAVDYVFPFLDGSFDVVFLASVFTHMLPDQVSNYLCQIYRVLRPGGYVLASCFLVDQDMSGRIAEGHATLGPTGGAADNVRRPAIELFTFDENTWVNDLEQLDACVAHAAENYRKLHEDAGLDLVNFWLRGHWSGEPNTERMAGQDIVVAQRPFVHTGVEG
jgi:SAM-dependent methyltransferase